jgi:WD40 repeat protein
MLPQPGRILDAHFDAAGTRVVTAGTDRTARIWDAKTGRRLRTLRGHAQAVTDASFSPDGTLVVTASRDHDARIWDARTGRLRATLRRTAGPVASAAFSPDGRWIVTAGPRNAGLWQVSSGRLLLFLRGHLKSVRRALFSPDGTRVVTASTDGTVRVYRCALCGTLDELVALGNARRAQLARPLTRAQRRRYLPASLR